RKAEVDSLLSVNKLDALSKLKAPTPPLTLLKERPDLFSLIYPCVAGDLQSAKSAFGDREEFFDLVLIEDRRSIPISDLLWLFRAGKSVAFAGDFDLDRKKPLQSFDLSHPAFDTLWDAVEVRNSASAVYGRDPALVSLLAAAAAAFRSDARCYGVPQATPEAVSEWVELNGFYNTEYPRANLQEAQYVVDRIMSFVMSPGEGSLSVVCVTAGQKDLVLQLLAHKMRHQSDLAKILSGPDKELSVTCVNEEIRPADVVILSCTFAPDRSVPGYRLPTDFLSYGRSDPKRALLDVLAAAGKRFVAVASFGMEELQHSATLFPVREALSLLYDLCHVGTVNNGYALSRDQFPTNAVVALDKKLREKGYHTLLNVHNGRFFVDLAVEQEGAFTLGVFSDQTVLNQKAHVAAIEYANTSLFKSNGWRVYRLRSSDTVDGLDREIEKVLTMLEKKESSVSELV
ncbi:MAG: hypothetical protein II776_06470, partial [Clostridia bacterium]|nr:hypothetical protein [Clostridia bacterium]